MRALKQALKHDLKLKKARFYQEAWLKKYIDK